MNAIEYKPTRARLALFVFGALVFAALGAAFVLWPQAFNHMHDIEVPTWSIAALGVAAILLALVAGVSIVRQLFDDRPRIVLDDEGLYDRTLNTPKIPWHSIAAAEIVAIRSTKFIALRLHDEESRVAGWSSWKRRATAANLALGFGRFNMSLTALSVSAEQLLGEMNARWDQARRARESSERRFRT